MFFRKLEEDFATLKMPTWFDGMIAKAYNFCLKATIVVGAVFLISLALWMAGYKF